MPETISNKKYQICLNIFLVPATVQQTCKSIGSKYVNFAGNIRSPSRLLNSAGVTER